MTVNKYFSVACDFCERLCGGGDDMTDSTAEARAFAKRSGWTRRNGKDICSNTDCQRASVGLLVVAAQDTKRDSDDD